MKLRKIIQLEFVYQIRQVTTWLYFAVVFGIAFLTITANYLDDARNGYFMINAPVVIASVAVVCSMFWLLIGASIAGDAAARDVQTRMFSLTYTSSATKAEYLGGRFIAAFVLNIMILLAIPAGILSATYLTGIEPGLLGPFRSASYLSILFYVILPNAFIATAIQFAMATLTRSAMASYLCGVTLAMTAYLGGQVLGALGLRDLETFMDPIYLNSVMNHLNDWSPIERNARLIEPDGAFMANRLLWLFITACMLAVAYFRFRFAIPSAGSAGKKNPSQPANVNDPGLLNWEKAELLPQVQAAYSPATHLHQLKVTTWTSFWALAKSRVGLVLLGCLAMVVGFAMPGNLKAKGVPLLPVTEQVLQVLTAPITSPGKFWIVIFLLIIFYAGQLIWRERDSGLSELANAAPVPEWILFLSKYLSLCLMLIVWLVFLLIAGVIAQIAIGGTYVGLGLYLKVLFGFQLIEGLLFALFALWIHVIINQKYLGHLVALIAFGCILFAPLLGIEHKLLIFGSSPKWSYTSMGGFGSSVAPWFWFKAYWAAWAVLLAVIASLLWVRSRDESLLRRLKLARRRFTRPTALAALIISGLILATGGHILYNTNILNNYTNEDEVSAGRAAYEHRYGRYAYTPQPHLTKVNLQVAIYPARREFELKGTYLLVNKQNVSIDTLLMAAPEGGTTTGITFNRPVIQVPADNGSGFFIYALKNPLKPGDTLLLNFKVYHKAGGFSNNGADSSITEKFAGLRNYEWLPVMGYQQYRELDNAGGRKKYGLAPRPATASVYNVKARNYAPFAEQVWVDALVSTDTDQVAIAPGTLQKTWKKGDRRYFHYITDAPIRNEYNFFSAAYALYEEQWVPPQGCGRPVSIQIYHDPANAMNLERMMKSVKASLDYYTKQFGPYRYRQLRFVAKPGRDGGNHAAPANITTGEGFFLMNPDKDARGFDLVTAVVAHEVAHQWWGNQLKSAYVEGAGLLSESLAWYSAMGVLEEKYGPEHLEKLLSFMREEYETPRTRAALPLLQAADFYQNYRKGPFALYTLSKYIGKSRVNMALSQLLQKHSPGKTPMATSLNLYQELEAVTPDSLRYLLHNLFKENTFWDLKAKHATIKQTKAGTWQVTFSVQARKFVVSERGEEKRVPLKDWIEVGIFAPAKNGEETGKLLYLQKHFLRSDQQTISVTVPVKPSRAVIDPNYLLTDWNIKDNLAEVSVEENSQK
ncbi:ABC transporter permease [Mucilaginibacter terrigena]|uniref:ABC transporter permease n=1 Tax=Mucilaginibacter terrigena TaxID=2492395 RepID=A0A4Q5LMA5_9SPHI|nr:M1 family aminopeptidase [Mucilaginibacter terrigena]RYU90707.1 ABC transporter permease [Mucilaginibacter terrigena]